MDQFHRVRAEPYGARPGFGIGQSSRYTVLGRFADLVPREIDHFGKPCAGERQQADCGNESRIGVFVTVEHSAEPFEFLAAEIACDRFRRVLRDVGAGVRN